MNYSPLNDPEFQEYRAAVRIKAAKKRRTKALILLASAALIFAILFGLLALAAAEAAPIIKDYFEEQLKKQSTDSPVLPSSPSEEQSQDQATPPAPESPSEDDSPTPPPASSSPSPSEPKPLRVTTVYLDPGHGFTNSYGALDVGAGEDSEYYKLSLQKFGAGLFEADLNLALSMKIKDLLEAEGYKVITSREDYVHSHLSVNDRAANAKKSGADLLVSVHGNSASPDAYGARVYYNSSNKTAEQDFSAVSHDLAKAVADAIDQNGASRRKAQALDGDYAMVRMVAMPAILVETCFLTNTEDSEMALTEEWQDAMAKSIVAGVMKCFPCQTYFE